MRELEQAVRSVNPNVPLTGVQTLADIDAKSMAQTSFAMVMLAIAGAMALFLGVAGIYGVISYSVSQRTREIGIRMALGARRSEVTGLFVRYGAGLAAVGIACGLAAAFALGKSSDVLALTDDKGRRFVVNSAKIAYVEIGVADARRVGFGIGADAVRKAGGKGSKSE